MVRTYKRQFTNVRNGKHFSPYKTYSDETLNDALRAIRNSSMTLNEASVRFHVPKATLSRKMRNLNVMQKTAGHPTLFTEQEEICFVQHLNMVSEWGYPFDTLDLRLLAKGYLDRKGRRVQALNNNMPGPDWAKNFLTRHKGKISNRYSVNISTKRASLTDEILDRFFENASERLKDINPELLINYDETNLTDNPGAKKFIFKRGVKYPERVVNSTKTAISIMYAGTAAGHIFEPYVVYKAEHLWNSWTEGGPPGCRYNRTKSGWFDSVTFEDWFMSVIVPYCRRKEGTKVLIGDNLSSHFSSTVLSRCEELDIQFICLPPNSTHIMQPLDVAFYAPLKKYWRETLSFWKKNEGRRFAALTKECFPSLLKQLHLKLENTGAQNIISGFNKTGLYPLNPARPKERLPSRHNNIEESVSEVVLNMLEGLRTPQNTGRRIRRKRVNVEAGKSITQEDLLQPTPGTSGVNAAQNPTNDADEIESEGANSNDASTDASEDEFGFKEKNEQVNQEPNAEHKIGDWVLVLYNTTTNVYVGMIKELDENDENEPYYIIDFVRRVRGSTQKFYYPTPSDRDTVSKDMIIGQIKEPTKVGTGRRAFYAFQEDLSAHNIP